MSVSTMRLPSHAGAQPRQRVAPGAGRRGPRAPGRDTPARRPRARSRWIAEGVVELQHVGREGLRIDERVERERRLAALQPQQVVAASRRCRARRCARTCVTSFGTFEVSAWWREMTTSGVHLPGVMPSILNSSGSAAGVAHRLVHVGVHAAHVGLDDRLAARMVVVQLGVEVAAELVQAGADVARSARAARGSRPRCRWRGGARSRTGRAGPWRPGSPAP